MPLKGTALTWYDGLPPRSIDKFDTLVDRFNGHYATSRSHHITSTALVSLRQEDDESLRKFMDKFGHTAIQIWNLNPEVALHSILKPRQVREQSVQKAPSSMGELCELAKGYIQMEEMSRFRNEVR